MNVWMIYERFPVAEHPCALFAQKEQEGRPTASLFFPQNSRNFRLLPASHTDERSSGATRCKISSNEVEIFEE